MDEVSNLVWSINAIVLAEALEVDPVELFGEIIEIYKEN